MANTSLPMILVILFWGSTIAAGTRSYPLRTQSAFTALPPAATEGICSSLVKIQGYACEEHLVLCLHLLLFLSETSKI